MASPNPQPFYSSDDLGTEVYDAVADLHIAGSPVEGDVEFFRLLARETAGPVLEVGCGQGVVMSRIPVAR